ncbi:hypothetical protein MMC31_004950, partial [Peltigera leucophlebia]|nr:hypothetical protein [Peltigera leucophlebia]
MDGNATDEGKHQEVEGGDDPQERCITWPNQEVDKSQRLILQPVSGNGAGRKAKGKAETHHGAKERSTNLTALKLIARQGADEKSQLEEWKADLLNNLTTEMAQLQKRHDDAMEAQREEIERQRERFEFEIEMLGKRIRELEKEREGLVQGHTQQENSSIRKRHTMEKEITEAPREESNIPAPVLPESSAERR